MENEQQQQEENMDFIDWLEIEKEYPLSLEALKNWFITKFEIPNSKIVIEQYSMLLTDGQGGLYLSPRDLYDFFDEYNVRPFVIPKDTYPKTSYLIQSKKSIMESEDIFEGRTEAEITMFKETFNYIEITIQREIDIITAKAIANQ